MEGRSQMGLFSALRVWKGTGERWLPIHYPALLAQLFVTLIPSMLV